MTETPNSDSIPLPRWYRIISSIGTFWAPTLLSGFAISLIGSPSTMTVVGQPLPVGMVIAISGIGVALLTWLVLGAIQPFIERRNHSAENAITNPPEEP